MEKGVAALYRDLLTKEELDALLDDPERADADDRPDMTVGELVSRVRELEEMLERMNQRLSRLEAASTKPDAWAESPVPVRFLPSAESGRAPAHEPAPGVEPSPSLLPSRKEKFGSRKSWFPF